MYHSHKDFPLTRAQVQAYVESFPQDSNELLARAGDGTKCLLAEAWRFHHPNFQDVCIQYDRAEVGVVDFYLKRWQAQLAAWIDHDFLGDNRITRKKLEQRGGLKAFIKRVTFEWEMLGVDTGGEQ